VNQTSANQAAKIWLERTTFYRNEKIRVHFQAPSGWSRDAWIGMIPSAIPHGDEAVNDQHDVAYQFIENKTSGSMTFAIPGPGNWDFRMHDTDKNGFQVYSVSFTVK